MTPEIRDRVRALGTEFDFMLAGVSNHLAHQLRRIASPPRVNRRFDVSNHADAGGLNIIGNRLAFWRVELVAVEMGIVAKSAHGSLANAGAAV